MQNSWKYWVLKVVHGSNLERGTDGALGNHIWGVKMFVCDIFPQFLSMFLASACTLRWRRLISFFASNRILVTMTSIGTDLQLYENHVGISNFQHSQESKLYWCKGPSLCSEGFEEMVLGWGRQDNCHEKRWFLTHWPQSVWRKLQTANEMRGMTLFACELDENLLLFPVPTNFGNFSVGDHLFSWLGSWAIMA